MAADAGGTRALTQFVAGNGRSSVDYQLPAGLFQYIQSVVATVDTSASGGVAPLLTIRDDAGIVVADKQQGQAIDAGGSGRATWALRLTDELTGLIRYGVENDGSYLHVMTEATAGFGGIVFQAEVGEIRFFVDDAVTGAFRVDAPFIRLDTPHASFRLLDSGETFFTCAGAASWSFTDFALASTLPSVEITLAGSSFTVLDSTGNPIFRVDEDGALHGKTGKALTFDL